MKRIFKSIAVLIAVLSVSACVGKKRTSDVIPPQVNKPECQRQAISQRFVVLWEDGTRSIEYASNIEELKKNLIEPNLENIQIAEPDYQVQLQSAVAKSGDFINWHHQAIQSDYAWDRGIQGQGVKIAVIDSGIDPDHPAFAGRILINSKEIANNGIDDDGNGYVDDYAGYDFYDNTGRLSDPNSHGTHVSGIIVGNHSNSSSVWAPKTKGVAPGAKVLPLRFLGPKGEGNLSDAIAALEYAAAQGVDIINASWGGSGCSEILNQSIRNLSKHNILFVSAAGNEGLNVDYTPIYPGVIDSDNIVNVAATSGNGPLAYFSNYGFKVHLAAPGTNIYSSVPGDNEGMMSGTSMAAPIVSGVLALLKSAKPGAGYAELKTLLLNSTKPRNLYVETRGEVNVKDILESPDLFVH